MTSDATLYDRDRKSVSALQKLRFFPLALRGGDGRYVIDDSDRRLLDLSGAWGAASLGYGHPAIRQSVDSALQSQAGASILSSTNAPAVMLAERLLQIVPGSGERRVWLGHSGSDANETVARAVVAATGRNRILAFTGAYHGGTQGSMAISGHSAQEGVAKSGGLTLVPYPNPYRPYEGDPNGNALLVHIETLLETSCPGEEVAAFFIEPIQADGGLIVPPAGFLRKLAKLCARYEILTVCDEVKVGLARPGKMNCFEWEDFTPDIVVLGKGLGGGLPISAVIGPAEIMNVTVSFSMQTLHGNPVCASAALAVLDTIQRENLITQAAETGDYLIKTFKSVQSGQPVIGDVRGRGLAIGIELVLNDAKTPATDLTRKVVYRAWELGAVFYYVGMQSNVLELTPPLTLTREEADKGTEIILRSIEDAIAGNVSDEAVAEFTGW
ncbi:aspartate aminotransferase family protein [Pseudohalocynthiibacter aestuariivivens]|uniref:Aspartate aminotransferase family protein n=1 Tax=Pseudohalocynthiibacter aestuariivivens TaxID=1591409 RepID=A0ABV5JGU3_9RHOB|nr:aspartate aminotransferase family protein [Pseudohalocynthiibacter aestuariivivens]MBS9718767.1 aspartate aminotransferase family protein [Pseudohalocynthiibacter aestuariivivens]